MSDITFDFEPEPPADMTFDFQPPSDGGSGVTVHNQLTGRDSDNAHPQSAVTGLVTALEDLTTGVAGANANANTRLLAALANTVPIITLTGAGSQALTLDHHHVLTLTGLKTLTLPAIPNDGVVHVIDVEVTNANAFAITWPTLVVDPAVPALSAISGRAIVTIKARNGVTPMAFVAGSAMA